ncbi:glutamate-gated chloride channel-like, partial [Lingula anatina]|uniref:Glutamate-gated chloride channel-like n=1 Tax=Lingula anatina TaxID=7574 RepID=A0A2R2MSE5_LINAN
MPSYVLFVCFVHRLSLTIGCQYNFLRFPMDTQFCKIQMSSYAYTVESLQLLWDEKEPIRFSKSDLNFPEFELVDIETDSGLILDKRGNYSVLTVNVLFSRDLRPYLLNVYIPSIVVVFLAFMSMWIDPRAVPARVTIGVITVLTTMTQSVNTQQGLPKVSYVKAVDVWLATCLVFVVGAMFEYALVNVMIQRLDDRKARGEIVDVKPALNSISPLSSDAKYLAGTPKQIYWNPAK